MNMSQVDLKKTLDIVKAINEYIARKEKELPYNINVIDELHANENAHSRILCKLLQYKDSSNKYRILEDLIQYISQLEGKEKFANIKIASPKIDQEQERIDLWVRDKVTGYAIIFENKVKGAVDQDAQLARYIDKTNKQGFASEKIFVIYLPNDDHEPEEYAWILDGKNYKKDFNTRYANLSFRTHILPWLKDNILPNCIIKEELLISAVRQYIDHLEGLFLMRPSQKKMIMNNELLEQIGLRADLGLAQQYKDFEKILNQLNDVKKILTDYRQNEAELLMKKFIEYSKEILGENDWETSKDNISSGGGWLYLYNKNWKTKSCVHLEWLFSIDDLFSSTKYKMVLHLEGGWNDKEKFTDELTKCSLIKREGKTTFYRREFESDLPLGQMTDEQLKKFLFGVYKSNDIQEIIKTIGIVNENM
jgi:hypothetical protein